MSLGNNQKTWNKQQKEFRQTLLGYKQHEKAMEMFLCQHAVLHAQEMAGSEAWSYEDELLEDLSDAQARIIPKGGEHSIVWVLWHAARIEDVTMNILVAGKPQCFTEEDWRRRLNVNVDHTANAMEAEEIAALSKMVDISALRAYRLAVGRNTRENGSQLTAADVRQKVDPARIQRVVAEGAVLKEAHSIVEYWSKRNIAGLLLMPPTRHSFLHLNEAARIKQKVMR